MLNQGFKRHVIASLRLNSAQVNIYERTEGSVAVHAGKSGRRKWGATRRTRPAGVCPDIGTCSTTATRSSARNSWRHGRRRSEVPATPCAEPELECFCGTLGAIGQRGVSIEADSVRGSFVEEGAIRIPRALPRRKKSSGQGQQAAVSSTHSTGISPSWEGSMPGTLRWAAQVL